MFTTLLLHLAFVTLPPQSGFESTPINVGDRVLPVGWGDGVPLYLSNTPATVVGIARTRIRVRFDGVSYGGKFPEFDSVNPRTVRVL